MKGLKSMLKYKILIKLFVLNFVFICCICGVTIQVEEVVLCLLVSLYSGHLYALATLLLGQELLVFNEQGGHWSGSEEKSFVCTRSQTTVS
jgi:hypothetical protein